MPAGWVTWFDLSADLQQLVPSSKVPILVPTKNCVGIHALNPNQVMVQDEMGFSVVDVSVEKVTFKMKA